MRFRFIDIAVVCYRLGIELTEQGTRLVGLCPLHAEEHPSFMVYPETNSFFCFSCEVGGGPLQLVSELIDGVISWRDLERWYEREDIALDQYPIGKMPSLSEIEALIVPNEPVVLPDASLSSDPFLAALGILYVKEGEFAGRHIIPISSNGALVAFEARDFVGRLTPKTLVMPPGVKIRSHLWNIDSIASGSPIVVVEGIKGAIAVMQFGYPSVVSTFGSKLSADQISLLLSKAPSEVVIAYDADPTGVTGTLEAVVNLIAWVDVYTVALPKGADPWDVSKETWDSCVAQRSKIWTVSRNRAVLDGFKREVLL